MKIYDEKFLMDLRERELVDSLLATGRYRIQRLLEPRPVNRRPLAADERIGLVIDTETTGLDPRVDEVIELGMVAFAYGADGDVRDVLGVYDELREPTVPITEEITRITGITQEMVAGRSLDMERVERLASEAVIVIAHNAVFDRPFCEGLSPVFRTQAWACSLEEIDWKARGFPSANLGALLAGVGLFHKAHRAEDDCHALLEVLAPKDGGTVLQDLLLSARKTRVRLSATGSPYETKDTLKRRGYRWGDGSDGRPKAWWIEVAEEALGAELAWLREEIYRREFEPVLERFTAFSRYRQG